MAQFSRMPIYEAPALARMPGSPSRAGIGMISPEQREQDRQEYEAAVARMREEADRLKRDAYEQYKNRPQQMPAFAKMPRVEMPPLQPMPKPEVSQPAAELPRLPSVKADTSYLQDPEFRARREESQRQKRETFEQYKDDPLYRSSHFASMPSGDYGPANRPLPQGEGAGGGESRELLEVLRDVAEALGELKTATEKLKREGAAPAPAAKQPGIQSDGSFVPMGKRGQQHQPAQPSVAPAATGAMPPGMAAVYRNRGR